MPNPNKPAGNNQNKPANTDNVKPEMSTLVVTSDTNAASPIKETAPETTPPPVVKDEPKQEPVQFEKPSLSIDEIYLRLDMLHALRIKREKLKESYDKLLKFKFSSDNKADNITLTDKDRNTFSTYSPEVIGKCVKWLITEHETRLAEVEADIKKIM